MKENLTYGFIDGLRGIIVGLIYLMKQLIKVYGIILFVMIFWPIMLFRSMLGIKRV